MTWSAVATLLLVLIHAMQTNMPLLTHFQSYAGLQGYAF